MIRELFLFPSFRDFRVFRGLILLLLLLMISGCTSVSSPYLIGEKTATADPAHWNGRWAPDCSESPGGEEFLIEVVDKEKGILRVTVVKTASNTVEEPVDCYLRQAGDWMIINAPDKADFYPARIKNTGKEMIILWLPDFDKFKNLVERGLLPGEVRDSNVSLGLLRPEHLKLIISDKEGVLFDWGDPAVLIRRSKTK